jgi:hypothetical protein
VIFLVMKRFDSRHLLQLAFNKTQAVLKTDVASASLYACASIDVLELELRTNTSTDPSEAELPIG